MGGGEFCSRGDSWHPEHHGGGVGPGAIARLLLQRSPTAGGGQHGPGKDGSWQGGQRWGWDYKGSPCSPRGHHTPCVGAPASVHPPRNPASTPQSPRCFLKLPHGPHLGVIPYPARSQSCEVGKKALYCRSSSAQPRTHRRAASWGGHSLSPSPPVGLGWAQPLLGVWVQVPVVVTGPRAAPGPAELGGHPAAAPQRVGPPGCRDALHLGWGHECGPNFPPNPAPQNPSSSPG